jgi:hypothetical protein
VTHAILDDHLLRDLLADDTGPDLQNLLSTHQPATTNLYHFRLCRSVVSARGGRLTGNWSAERRQTLGRSLVNLPEELLVVPMRSLTFRMAQLAMDHRISTLGAEAVAAAETLGGPLCVWTGDDGPGIRTCAEANGVPYRTATH